MALLLQPLHRSHRPLLADFQNPQPSLVDYLKRYALRHSEKNLLARTYLALDGDSASPRLAGYFSLTTVSVERVTLTALPALDRLPRFPAGTAGGRYAHQWPRKGRFHARLMPSALTDLLNQLIQHLLRCIISSPGKENRHSGSKSIVGDCRKWIGIDVDLIVVQLVSKLAECYSSDRGYTSFTQECGGYAKGHAKGGAVINDDYMLIYQLLLVKRVEMKC